ncbi:DUF294 nucleotidyltransferase-like domain-containing protein [Paenibacillus sp. GCM10027626]|uniref:DUF294 nucleotidyltransferase-like domain-containing protein n=1 Tax=Paenibacillus sp. GCM10027626 TaxID=3273411 RepID=UPI0036D2C2AB
MNDRGYARLLMQIGKADSIDMLRLLRAQAHVIIESQLAEGDIVALNDKLNEVHDALIRRTIALAELQLKAMQVEKPPVSYAYVLFGSGGRKEQTLGSDQDSGIIYCETDSESANAQTARYFDSLSRLVVDWLTRLGYPPCEGAVVSRNPQWRASCSAWEAKLRHWFDEADWESVRYLLIFADSRVIYGDQRLLTNLKRQFAAEVRNNPSIIPPMLRNTLRHKVVIGLFGQLLRERYGADSGSVDIKYGAYIPMVNAIRLMAIQSGVEAASTLERLYALQEMEQISAENAKVYHRAFAQFLQLRLEIFGLDDSGAYLNSGKLPVSKLNKAVISRLKREMKAVKKLQRAVEGKI